MNAGELQLTIQNAVNQSLHAGTNPAHVITILEVLKLEVFSQMSKARDEEPIIKKSTILPPNGFQR